MHFHDRVGEWDASTTVDKEQVFVVANFLVRFPDPLADRSQAGTLSDLGLTDEEGFERARRVVPGKARPVPVPHLEAVLLLTVVVLEVVRLARVPVGVPGRHL